MRKQPRCFISYAWDGKRHESWIARLAEALVANGVVVYVDFWETHLGMDITHYMESRVRNSTHVLIICTPKYADKADGRKGGVGYETSILTSSLFTKTRSKKKFVPLLRVGEPKKALPTFLKGALYLDFRNRAFVEPLKKLLRHVFDVRERQKPVVGGPPNFDRPIVPPRTKPSVASNEPPKPSVVRRKQQKIKKLMKTTYPPTSTREQIRVKAIKTASRDILQSSARKLAKSAKVI